MRSTPWRNQCSALAPGRRRPSLDSRWQLLSKNCHLPMLSSPPLLCQSELSHDMLHRVPKGPGWEPRECGNCLRSGRPACFLALPGIDIPNPFNRDLMRPHFLFCLPCPHALPQSCSELWRAAGTTGTKHRASQLGSRGSQLPIVLPVSQMSKLRPGEFVRVRVPPLLSPGQLHLLNTEGPFLLLPWVTPQLF